MLRGNFGLRSRNWAEAIAGYHEARRHWHRLAEEIGAVEAVKDDDGLNLKTCIGGASWKALLSDPPGNSGEDPARAQTCRCRNAGAFAATAPYIYATQIPVSIVGNGVAWLFSPLFAHTRLTSIPPASERLRQGPAFLFLGSASPTASDQGYDDSRRFERLPLAQFCRTHQDIASMRSSTHRD